MKFKLRLKFNYCLPINNAAFIIDYLEILFIFTNALETKLHPNFKKPIVFPLLVISLLFVCDFLYDFMYNVISEACVSDMQYYLKCVENFRLC